MTSKMGSGKQSVVDLLVVERLRRYAGKPADFERLYRAYISALVSVSKNLGKDRETVVDDLVNEWVTASNDT